MVYERNCGSIVMLSGMIENEEVSGGTLVSGEGELLPLSRGGG